MQLFLNTYILRNSIHIFVQFIIIIIQEIGIVISIIIQSIYFESNVLEIGIYEIVTFLEKQKKVLLSLLFLRVWLLSQTQF